MKNNVVTRMLNPFFKEIWGENPLTFYFSFKGTFNRLQFWGALITINVFVNLIDIQDFWLLFVLAFPIAFCATLAALQKRCRDINYNGTIATLAYSLTFLHDFKHVALPDCLNDIWGVFGISYMVIAVFLVLFPGRKEKKARYCRSSAETPLFICACLEHFVLAGGSNFIQPRPCQTSRCLIF